MLQRELVPGDVDEGLGQLVDGVVGARLGAVAALVGDGELVVAIHLLGGAEPEHGRHALLAAYRVAVGIDHELRIDQVAVVLDEPVRAVAAAALLVGGEREDDVAVGLVALLLHAQQRCHHDGIVALHVRGATAVEVAVLLGELEGIEVPVLAVRLDDIDVPDQQHRLVLACAVQAHDQVLLLGVLGAEHRHVGRREAGVAEALGHRLDACGHVAGRRVGGVDLDQLLEHIVRQHVRGLVGGVLRAEGGAGDARSRQRCSEDRGGT